MENGLSPKICINGNERCIIIPVLIRDVAGKPGIEPQARAQYLRPMFVFERGTG
jgi:hypothetical protein